MRTSMEHMGFRAQVQCNPFTQDAAGGEVQKSRRGLIHQKKTGQVDHLHKSGSNTTRQRSPQEPTVYPETYSTPQSTGHAFWGSWRHMLPYPEPPPKLHVTMVKEKEAYLDVTGEDDLLETLLRGDMRPTLGTEAVALGPLFIFSVCRRHRIGQPWPITSMILKNTPDGSDAQLFFRRNQTKLYCFPPWPSLQKSTRRSSHLGHSVRGKNFSLKT